MNTTSTGKYAESVVADWLDQQGFILIEQNWKTRWCEIDVIAKKQSCIYFVEVRYRKSAAWGDGLESITAKKQQQMRFAAELWLQSHTWNGEAVLCAAAVAGEPAAVTSFVEL